MAEKRNGGRGGKAQAAAEVEPPVALRVPMTALDYKDLPKAIVVVGDRGVGKTTVANYLKEKYGYLITAREEASPEYVATMLREGHHIVIDHTPREREPWWAMIPAMRNNKFLVWAVIPNGLPSEPVDRAHAPDVVLRGIGVGPDRFNAEVEHFITITAQHTRCMLNRSEGIIVQTDTAHELTDLRLVFPNPIVLASKKAPIHVLSMSMAIRLYRQHFKNLGTEVPVGPESTDILLMAVRRWVCDRAVQEGWALASWAGSEQCLLYAFHLEILEEPQPVIKHIHAWDQLVNMGWTITGMNHYYVNGERHLYVAMSRNGMMIKSEGTQDAAIFADLQGQAEARINAAVTTQLVNC